MTDEAKEGYRDEMLSAWLYEIVAACEHDEQRQRMFLQLRDAARGQARIWAGKLETVPPLTIGARARFVAWLVRRIGPRAARHALAALKVRGLSVYRPELPSAPHEKPQHVSDIGGRHRSVVGSNLRASVFGANDGLLSNLSLILGVAGASQSPETIALSGLAGWLAGATSMAAGEWVSVRAQAELFEYQIGLERAELSLYPEEEAQELAMIYRARGFSEEQARSLATTLTADPERAIDVLAREELGLNPDDLGSAWRAAIASFTSFSIGAWIPSVALLIGARYGIGLYLTVVSSAVALFALGAAISLFTGRSMLFGGVRMLLIGAAAGALSYLVGDWFAVLL